MSTALHAYLIGWVITSIGLAVFTRLRPRPALVVVAGAVWPLLVLGAAQFAAVAAVAEIARFGGRNPKSIDDELEALLAKADSGDRLGV